MSQKKRGAQKDSRQSQFMKRVIDGEEKTTREWAGEFFPDRHIVVGIHRIHQLMKRARMRGVMLFPVPTGDGKPGVIKFVNDDQTEFVHTYNRHTSDQVERSITSNMRLAESLVNNHPKVKPQVVRRVQEMLTTAANAEQHIIQLSYEPSTGFLATVKDSIRRITAKKDV